MDNSKYLALVDLMGKDGADQVREDAAKFLASLDCEFKPEIRQDCGAVNWRGMPLLCHDLDCLEDEWACKYCGKVNPASAKACGEGVWDGCGASRPECDEPPRGVLHLPQTRKYLSEIQDRHSQRPLPEMHFYPEPSMAVTHPGQTAQEHKKAIADFWHRGIGMRMAAAIKEAIKWA